MRIFGKNLSEYVLFTRGFLAVVLAVGIVRLALSLAGVANSTVQWISISVVAVVGVVYFPVKIQTSGFGTYKHLFPLNVIQGVVRNAPVVAGIVIAIVTGKDNIFSIPENSGGSDGKTWLHAGSHAVLGTTAGPVLDWLIGCLIIFTVKRIFTGAR